MFGKLKEKLKNALNVFSQKAEEEAEEKKEEVVEEVSREEFKDSTEKKELATKEEIKPEEVEATPVQEKEMNFVIKESDISGEGVFADKNFHKGEEIGIAFREIGNSGLPDQDYERTELGAKTNHSNKPNVELHKSGSNYHFKATKEIQKGEEILVDYKNFPWEGELDFLSGTDEKEPEEKKAAGTKEPEKKVATKVPEQLVEEVVEEKETVEAQKLQIDEQPTFFRKIKDSFLKKKEEATTEVEKEKEPIKEEVQEPITIVEKEEILETEQPPETKTFFGKVKKTLTTKTINEEKFEELFWELELALLENNVSVDVIGKIKEDLKKELVNQPLPRDVSGKIEETLKRTLDFILSYDAVDLVREIKKKEKKPFVVAFFGINGAGKTTSIAKLTYYLQQQSHSVVLAACDTFRAAAIQQLQEHADKLGVKIIKHDYGSDAAAVAYDAIKYAEKNNIDVVLIDTAGRLHSNTNLMAELEKIIRVTKPDLKLFVGESITGNDCIEQAQKFNELVEMDGAILTKADVDEKGGAPLSISYVIKKPILFLGMGQQYKDLEKFNKEKVLERLGL